MTDSRGEGLATTPDGNTPGEMQRAVDVSKRAAKGLAGDLKSEAAALGAEAKKAVGEAATSRMATVADSIEGLSQGLADTSANLDETWAKPLVGHAAEALQTVATYVRESDPETLIHDGQRLARDRPGAVFVGSVAVGFALARAGKALLAQMPAKPSGPERSNGAPS